MKHLAIVMDGNRRWAQKLGLQSWLGHKEGAKRIETAMEFCITQNIRYLSLYTFSLENFKRSEQERAYLFDLIANETEQQLPIFLKYGVRVSFLGDRSLFPLATLPAIELVEEQTKHMDRLIVNFLFCYGARQEILYGIKTILKKVKAGLLREQDITEQDISEHLWTNGIPEPDLIIRTGGAKRLSNFLLYQAAYSELHFLDCLWPELTKDHLEGAIAQYNECKRNFGT
jgi:undecaprenyl diphosphate synthase